MEPDVRQRLASASADLVHRILRDGQIVLDRDRARRLRAGDMTTS